MTGVEVTPAPDPTLSPPPSAADITAAIPDTTPEAPAEHADRTPVLSPARDAAPSSALGAALPPALEANATTDGDASGTADAIDNNTATRLPLQLEVHTQLRNPTPASLQAAARQTVQFFVQVHT